MLETMHFTVNPIASILPVRSCKIRRDVDSASILRAAHARSSDAQSLPTSLGKVEGFRSLPFILPPAITLYSNHTSFLRISSLV